MSWISEVPALGRDVIAVVRQREPRFAVLLYAALSVLAYAYALATSGIFWALFSVVLGIVLMPVVEFIVHKYVLHILVLAKTPATAQFWDRVHYAHHMEPKDPSVILAHPASTVLLVAVIGTIAWAIGVRPAPIVGISFALFAFYEIVHFACHMDYDFESSYFRYRRQAHAIHHYIDENRNFGITSSVADRLLGTLVGDKKELKRSPTVRNLGYTGEFADRYPYLKRPETPAEPASPPQS
jgi:sterol desaturase/sphingolipid hydroxylase (fatty acid hydroxylase superfamily)